MEERYIYVQNGKFAEKGAAIQRQISSVGSCTANSSAKRISIYETNISKNYVFDIFPGSFREA
jgi:hypothetical protein